MDNSNLMYLKDDPCHLATIKSENKNDVPDFDAVLENISNQNLHNFSPVNENFASFSTIDLLGGESSFLPSTDDNSNCFGPRTSWFSESPPNIFNLSNNRDNDDQNNTIFRSKLPNTYADSLNIDGNMLEGYKKCYLDFNQCNLKNQNFYASSTETFVTSSANLHNSTTSSENCISNTQKTENVSTCTDLLTEFNIDSFWKSEIEPKSEKVDVSEDFFYSDLGSFHLENDNTKEVVAAVDEGPQAMDSVPRELTNNCDESKMWPKFIQENTSYPNLFPEFELDMLFNSPQKTNDWGETKNNGESYFRPDSLDTSSSEKEKIDEITPLANELCPAISEEVDCTMPHQNNTPTLPTSHDVEHLNSCSKTKMNTKSAHRSKMNSLIALRRVKYNLGSVSTSNKSSSSETICFATHPAVKHYRKFHSKKITPKHPSDSLNVRKENKVNLNNVFKLYNQKSNTVNFTNSSHSSVVLPVGDTGCSITIPSLANVDINSFSSQPVFNKNVESKNVFNPVANTVLPTPQEDLKNSSLVLKEPKIVHNKFLESQKNKSDKYLRVKKVSKYNQEWHTNLRNILKIEIYTKPPKKMILTKCSNLINHSNKSEFEVSKNQKECSSKNSSLKLNRFMDLLRHSIQGITDDVMKELCLPLDAVRRSYLTSVEISCIERQIFLLKSLKELRHDHKCYSRSTCKICKEIKRMEDELAELHEWKYSKILKSQLSKSHLKPDYKSINLGNSEGTPIDYDDSTCFLQGPRENPSKTLQIGPVLRSMDNLKNCSDTNQQSLESSHKLKPFSTNSIRLLEDCLGDDRKEQEALVVSLCEGEKQKQHYIPTKPLLSPINQRQWKAAQHFLREAENLQKFLMNYSQDKIRCSCSDHCRSFLECSCSIEGVACVGCSCCSCENPMKIFQLYDISFAQAKMDSCLMQAIYSMQVLNCKGTTFGSSEDFPHQFYIFPLPLSDNHAVVTCTNKHFDSLNLDLKGLLELDEIVNALNHDHIVPCCKNSLKTSEVVPNVVECLHCSATLSFSWCQFEVRDERSYEKNHCLICRKCQPQLESHCYLCEACTLSTAAGKCLVCDEDKIFSF